MKNFRTKYKILNLIKQTKKWPNQKANKSTYQLYRNKLNN